MFIMTKPHSYSQPPGFHQTKCLLARTVYKFSSRHRNLAEPKECFSVIFLKLFCDKPLFPNLSIIHYLQRGILNIKRQYNDWQTDNSEFLKTLNLIVVHCTLVDKSSWSKRTFSIISSQNCSRILMDIWYVFGSFDFSAFQDLWNFKNTQYIAFVHAALC